MKLFNMEERNFRKILKERRFFEGVIFEDRESKDVITDWIFKLLKYRNVRFEKFMHIFLEMYEFTFPIIIKKDVINSRYAKVIIIAANGAKYAMRINKNDTRMEEYLILRIGDDKVSEKTWVYKLLSPNQNVLKEIYEKILNQSQNEVERECIIEYNWESNIIKAIAETERGAKSVYINLKAEDLDEADAIMDMLENINLNQAPKNVLGTFKEMTEVLKEKEDIISVQAFANDNEVSEIVVDKGVVVRYSFTRHLEQRRQFIMQIETPYLKIEEFIRKNHYRL